MKTYKDNCFKNIKYLIERIRIENDKQINKWGVQNCSSFEWLAYLTEEIGELANTINEHEYRSGSKSKIVSEAIQVATLALKIAEIFEFDVL